MKSYRGSRNRLSRRKSESSNHKSVIRRLTNTDDESNDEDEGYTSQSESRIKPLIVKVKDPFVEAAELASLVSATSNIVASRSLPI